MAAETMPCPVCEQVQPTAGPEGVLRHVLLEHPDHPLTEAIREQIADYWKAVAK